MDWNNYVENKSPTEKVVESKSELELFNRVYNGIIERRERLLSGKINCIPWGLPRLEEEIPGIEQGKFFGITANQKVGKSQLTDFLFVYNPILYVINNLNKIKLKIFYVTLEMSKEQKYQQYMCHLLYLLSKGRIRISPKDLRSTSKDKPVSDEILSLLNTEEYEAFFKCFEATVTFIDSIRNPFGIYSMMRDYATNNGTQHTKVVEIVDKSTGEIKDKITVDDYYEPHDPEEYVILIVDHLSLMTPERSEDNDLRKSIVKFTSDYCVKLRNKYKYTIVVVQQQAQAQESVENLKVNRLRPTADGLGEAKITSRDFDYLIGLFSPFRHDIASYHGYDITKFRDNIRFLEIIAGREGGGGSLDPLYFDGAVNFFRELPKPNDIEGLNIFYEMMRNIKNI